MTNIEIIRELHCYKKMYRTLQRTVTRCIETCKDPVVRETLIKVQQEAEDIYTGEIYEYKELNDDEYTIVALLNFIIDRDSSLENDEDLELIEDCVDWALTLQNKKVHLSEEYIEEQVNKIFGLAEEKEDSEQ